MLDLKIKLERIKGLYLTNLSKSGSIWKMSSLCNLKINQNDCKLIHTILHTIKTDFQEENILSVLFQNTLFMLFETLTV